MTARPAARTLAAILLAVGTAAGCGEPRFKETFPARVKVEFEGKPPVGATIVLRPAAGSDAKTIPTVGTVGEDGVVVFSTYKTNDGAPAGEYAVTAHWFAGNSPNKLPARYQDPATSGLRAKIEGRPNELEVIRLTK